MARLRRYLIKPTRTGNVTPGDLSALYTALTTDPSVTNATNDGKPESDPPASDHKIDN